MKEKPGRKKKEANNVFQHVRTDFWCMSDKEPLESLDAVYYYIETRTNQWTGFYMTGTSVME